MRKFLLTLLLLTTVAPLHAQTQIDQFQVLQLGKQTTSPGIPSYATAFFYLDSTGHLACTNSDGTSCLSGGGGGGGGCPLTGPGPCTLTSVFGTAPIPPPAGESALSWDTSGNPVCSINGGAYALCPSNIGGAVVLQPAQSQTVVQPVAGGTTTALSVNNFSNIRIAQQFDWSQLPSGTISIGANTITLAPCPAGVDTSNNTSAPYSVYLTPLGTPEAVVVTGGTCTPGAVNGTIVFTAANAHSAGYTARSA